jgi:hypothetical protein
LAKEKEKSNTTNKKNQTTAKKKSSKNQTINQKEELNSNVVRRVDHQHNKSLKKTSTLTSPKKNRLLNFRTSQSFKTQTKSTKQIE